MSRIKKGYKDKITVATRQGMQTAFEGIIIFFLTEENIRK